MGHGLNRTEGLRRSQLRPGTSDLQLFARLIRGVYTVWFPYPRTLRLTSSHPVFQPDPTALAAHRKRLRRHRRALLMRLMSRLPTAPLRLTPDFLIIGAAKCGTTTLFAYLEQSPHVAWSLRKETMFFSHTFHWGRNWYRAFFPLKSKRNAILRAGGGPVRVGEGTPDYLFHPLVPRRVHETLPEAKLVTILRNPVDRAYSFYKHQIQRTQEPLSFEEAIAQEEARLAGERERMEQDPKYHSIARQNCSYLARGRYMEQIEGWLQFFPREQMLFLLMDDLIEDPGSTVRTMTDFLELPPIEVQVPKRAHQSVKIDPMSPEMRAQLVEYFRPHNAKLEEFLGRRLDWDQ